MSGQKILVIDHDGPNRKLLRNLLAVGSYEVLEASDAESGIRIARESMPACILMDLRLPGMDGIAATRLMKADPGLARIPVVAVTAAVMSGDEHRALDAGCDGYVAKPIDTRAFLGNIRHFLQTTSQGAPGTAPAAAPRVLVVDDEPSARLLFSTWLKLEGFQPIEASSGTEAIALAHREDPDLVLLDVIMPDIDGFEVARRLKGNLQTLAIPVILVTGLSDGASRARGAECGADEFLTKPIDRVELMVRMKSMLRLKRAYERLARAAQAEDLTGTARMAAPGGQGDGQTLVVLAERDDAVAGALEGALHPAACRVLRAGTAAEVLEHVGGQDVDVLLLGMLAEGVAGARELCSLLKEEEKTRNVQIIVVSASNRAGERIEALECGADDYCALPLAREELAVRVRQHALRKARLDMLLAGYRTAMSAAASDGLTGLANNKELKRLLDLEIRRARRHGSQGALLILDIDDFKKKNDSFGHLAGDRLLAELAQVVKASIRDIDVAARYGGEEFAVLLPHTDASGAAVVAERLRAAVAGHCFLDGALAPDATVTVSVGAAYFPEETAGVDDLISRADGMLYQAKREGKNRVCAPGAPDKA